MKKPLLLLFALLAVCTMQAQEEILYGVYTGSGTLKGMGTQKAETYDVAMHLQDPALVGMQIVGINVPLNEGATVTDCKAWLTSELALDGGKNVADIAEAEFTADGKWVEVTFAEPYTVTEAGLYAGYTLTVPSVVASQDADPNKRPIMCVSSEDIGNLYIHTSRSVRKWRQLAETAYYSTGAYAMVVRLKGPQVKEYAVSVLPPDELSTYVLKGKSVTLTLQLENHGLADITNIDYYVAIDGQRAEEADRHVNVSLKGGYYGRRANLKVQLPVVSEAGSREVNVVVTKLNGNDNEDAAPGTTFSMAYLSEYPKHKPLMEEYTGTWCQYCPRGMAGMEGMNKLYGDDFVGVAFHNGDPMQVTALYPNDVNSFPNGYLDRVLNVNPFSGTSGGSLGIKDDWKRRQNIIAPASIELKAVWADEAQTKLEVTSTTTFVRDFKNSPYQLTYILTADGLKGDTNDWWQVNALSGDAEAKKDPYLAVFANQSSPIKNIEYNDVAIQLSNSRALAMEGTLPGSVEGGKGYEHKYVFDVTENALVQDKTKLRPVVVLIDTTTGEAVNADKVGVSSETDGISEIPSDDELQRADGRSYDLQGRELNAAHRAMRGIYIVNGKKVIR